MIEWLALATGALSVGFLLGREYAEVFRRPEGDPSDLQHAFDRRAASRGTVVPTEEGSEHPLWVQIGGELWKAEAKGAVPAPGSEVEVLSTSGYIATIRTLESDRRRAAHSSPHFLTFGRRVGLALWALTVALCWWGVGSPALALVGVPMGWLAFWILLGGVDFG